jgi:Flp pilus assembly protein TadG
VEFALVLPLLAALLLALVQTGLVVRDQVLVVHAAREAVRELAVRDGAPARPAGRPDKADEGGKRGKAGKAGGASGQAGSPPSRAQARAEASAGPNGEAAASAPGQASGQTSGPGAGEAAVARRAVLAAAGSVLDPDRLDVEVLPRPSGRVAVRVGYRVPITLPLLDFAVRSVRLVAYAEMQREID